MLLRERRALGLVRTLRLRRYLEELGPGRSGLPLLLVAEGEPREGPGARVEPLALGELRARRRVVPCFHRLLGGVEEGLGRGRVVGILGRGEARSRTAPETEHRCDGRNSSRVC